MYRIVLKCRKMNSSRINAVMIVVLLRNSGDDFVTIVTIISPFSDYSYLRLLNE